MSAMLYEDKSKTKEDLIAEREELRKKLHRVENLYQVALMHLHETAGDRCEYPCICDGMNDCPMLESDILNLGSLGKFPVYWCRENHYVMTKDQAMEDKS